MTNPTDYFDRFLALQEMMLNAAEDLKQLRVDAIEELITEGVTKEKAKEIRADLAEVIALAKIKAKGDMEERKQAEKMARRRRVAEECGVQLDLLPAMPPPKVSSPIRAATEAIADENSTLPGAKKFRDMVKRGELKIETALANGAGKVTIEPDGAGGMKVEREPDAFDDSDDDADDDRIATHTSEPAAVHAGGMNDRDWDALGEIPDFLRRS